MFSASTSATKDSKRRKIGEIMSSCDIAYGKVCGGSEAHAVGVGNPLVGCPGEAACHGEESRIKDLTTEQRNSDLNALTRISSSLQQLRRQLLSESHGHTCGRLFGC